MMFSRLCTPCRRMTAVGKVFFMAVVAEGDHAVAVEDPLVKLLFTAEGEYPRLEPPGMLQTSGSSRLTTAKSSAVWFSKMRSLASMYSW